MKRNTSIDKEIKSRLNYLDTAIFSSLARAKRPLTVKKLALRVDSSWPTVNNHVNKLRGFGVIKVKKSIRRTNVFVSPAYKKKLLEKGLW